MKFYFVSFLFFFSLSCFSKNPPKKVLQEIPKSVSPKSDPTDTKHLVCTERGCSCEGPGCSHTDSRRIKNASTLSISCSNIKNCGQKIVYKLMDKYGCKASAQKLEGTDYLIFSECLILAIGGPTVCPQKTKAEYIEELIQICLEVHDSTEN